MPAFTDRLAHAWNAFLNKDSTDYYGGRELSNTFEYGSNFRPDRPRFTRGNERSILTSIYNRMALDCASVDIQHVQLDENNRYVSTIDSGLNNCLTVEANIDQTGRAFRQDIYMSMFDEGCVAIVATDTDINPLDTSSYDILSMRTGKVTAWYPKHVRVKLYDENTASHREVVLPKSKVAIIENPFYAVMNEPNSTLQRLKRKLVLIDQIDEQAGANKLDLIIQLPYVVKSEARKQQAEKRRAEIENQLANGKYGIAYTDGTEHITQLNRSIDNQLLSQIEYLTNQLYSQLGMTTAILDGTADERTMLNYNNRVIEVCVSAVVDEFKRTFLTKTARTQKKSIMFFRDPFRLVPVDNLADIADKFTRNEILSSNEVRQIIGLKPINDPKADELRNKNLNVAEGQEYATTNPTAQVEGSTEETENYDAENMAQMPASLFNQ